MDVEEDVTTESVDSIEYIGKHGKQRPATTEPVDSIEFIGKPAKISLSFSSSQKSNKLESQSPREEKKCKHINKIHVVRKISIETYKLRKYV